MNVASLKDDHDSARIAEQAAVANITQSAEIFAILFIKQNALRQIGLVPVYANLTISYSVGRPRFFRRVGSERPHTH